MPDYHPLIARAVAGLERNTGENRRALYERARTALVAQLRGISPALNESDITRERLSLEDAIRKVESEAARRGRGEMPEEGGASRGEPDMPGLPRSAAPRPPAPSLSDQGLKGFRQVVAGAAGLGGASAEASKNAREAYNTIPDDERRAPYLRREPGFPAPPLPPAAKPSDAAQQPDQGLDREPGQEPDHEPPPFGEHALDGVTPHEPQPGVAPAHDEQAAPSDAETRAPAAPDTRSESEAFRDTLPESAPPHQERDSATARYDDTEGGYEGPRRSYRGMVKWAVIALLVIGVAALGYSQRGALSSMMASMRSSAPPPAAPSASTERPKITDRVGSNDSRSATSPTAAVAQKVVLYDEDSADPQGKRYVGSAIWRTETVSPGPGMAPELAIRADVEIPERRIKMSWSLRRNTDRALPASHTIEILFTLPADFAEGGISNIPGVLMKQTEQTRGVPLSGLAVKVTNGFFLIGLSAVDVDMQRNVELLKQRSWFDIPLVYNNNKRAILAVEKGAPGDRVFEEAFRTWGQ